MAGFLTAVVVDFETASPADLKTVGSRVYAEHPLTEILCLCWRVRGSDVRESWVPGQDETRLRALAADPTVTFIAHNAAFEQDVWEAVMVYRYGFPELPPQRWHDTMAACAMKVVPLKLEQALPAVGLPIEKDMEGSKLTISLSKPVRDTKKTRADGTAGSFDRSPETLARVIQYCHSDVDAEMALLGKVGFLPPGERGVYLHDRIINHRGVKIDTHLVEAMQTAVARATVPMAKRFTQLTGLEPGQRDKIMAWVKDQGVDLPNLQKATLDKIFGSEDEEDDDDAMDDDEPVLELPDHVKEALLIRRRVGSASVKKLRRIALCVAANGRACNLLQYHGAGTGRWAGRLLQPQNFPKGVLESKDVDFIVDTIMSGDPEWIELALGCHTIEAVGSALRHTLISEPGKLLVVGDLAQIEARIVLALAGQTDKVRMLAQGLDPYCDLASLIYKFPVLKAQHPKERNIGKAGVLGLGFQMAAKTFLSRMAPDEPLEFGQNIVKTYRENWAPQVPKLWRGLEEAALAALKTRRPHGFRGVEYQVEGQWLTARLPSGRKLWYLDPQLCYRAVPWDPDEKRLAWTYVAKKKGRLVRVDAYGGLLTENAVQALARDLLVYGMKLCEKENMPVVLTVHDEAVTEVDIDKAQPKVLEQIMTTSPDWARQMGIPVAAECWAAERYRK